MHKRQNLTLPGREPRQHAAVIGILRGRADPQRLQNLPRHVAAAAQNQRNHLLHHGSRLAFRDEPERSGSQH
jgi:hypothetical protein